MLRKFHLSHDFQVFLEVNCAIKYQTASRKWPNLHPSRHSFAISFVESARLHRQKFFNPDNLNQVYRVFFHRVTLLLKLLNLTIELQDLLIQLSVLLLEALQLVVVLILTERRLKLLDPAMCLDCEGLVLLALLTVSDFLKVQTLFHYLTDNCLLDLGQLVLSRFFEHLL